MWIANLCDGSTVAEKNMAWDALDPSKITCLHITNGNNSAFIRARDGYQFFQYKTKTSVYVPGKGVYTTPVQWQRIGAVINRRGDCIYIQMDATGGIDVRFDNVLDMRVNLPLFNIKLHPWVFRARLLKEQNPNVRAYLQELLKTSVTGVEPSERDLIVP